MLLALEYLH
jgi:serine/threonine protein kinase